MIAKKNCLSRYIVTANVNSFFVYYTLPISFMYFDGEGIATVMKMNFSSLYKVTADSSSLLSYTLPISVMYFDGAGSPPWLRQKFVYHERC